ncbi:MAG: response regulator [Planctomycetota bacterium]
MAKKILVVDDDQNAVTFLSAVLGDHGYETTAAYDGKEGMDKIKDTKPDLIVLDVMMPKKTGFVLFKQLKKNEALKDIPVLMLTAVAGVLEELDRKKENTFEGPYDSLREALRKSIRDMRDEGFVRPEMFVDKPVDPDVFLNKVQELIGK